LIDELSVSIVPGLIACAGTPTILEGQSLAVGEGPTPLRLLSVHADVGGTVRLR
jgi:hypothetical protein